MKLDPLKVREIVMKRVAQSMLTDKKQEARIADTIQQLSSLKLLKGITTAELLVAMEIASIEIVEKFIEFQQKGNYVGDALPMLARQPNERIN